MTDSSGFHKHEEGTRRKGRLVHSVNIIFGSQNTETVVRLTLLAGVSLLSAVGAVLALFVVVSCSPAPSSEGDGVIAPIEFVRFNGITYVRAGPLKNAVVPSRTVDRGSLVGRVEVRRSEPGGMPDSNEPRDGYASSLEPGTPVYAVEGYEPSFRVTARVGGTDGAWALYEVAENPRAQKGARLLDIQGKVRYVGVLKGNYDRGEKETVIIRDPERVAALVDAVVSAPIRKLSTAPTSHHVVFHLEDGTVSFHRFKPRSGALYLSQGDAYSGVLLPERFRESIQEALRERQ